MSGGSLLLHFKELLQLYASITEESYQEEFLRFVASQEEGRQKWLGTTKENKQLKSAVDQLNKEVIVLEGKLSTARKLLDQEREKRLFAEEEMNKNEKQLQMVRDLLLPDNINVRSHIPDETKEKLKFLNSTIKNRMSHDYNCNDRLTTIRELETTGSILSDLSYSRSEEELDLDEGNHNKRTRKLCPSLVLEEPYYAKRRRSHTIEKSVELKENERLVARTTVTVEHDGYMSAQSQIETVPALSDGLPHLPSQYSVESLESSDLSVESHIKCEQTTPKSTDLGVLPTYSRFKIVMQKHSLVTKTVIRPEECDVCEKRIKFGSSVIRCQTCKSSCHSYCTDQLPLPCIEPGNTPVSKKYMGVIADYAPNSSPMIPSLVVHCVNEIENRGLNESGIYKLSAGEKDIKALKSKFMKFRGVPRLANLDIHIVCGCLTEFLRGLRESLVTNALWWQFARAAEKSGLEERRTEFYQAISQLPQANRDTLAYLLLHLLRVAEAQEMNKMTVKNLATVLGSTVVGYTSDSSSSDVFTQTSKAAMVLEQLLTTVPSEYLAQVMTSTSLRTPKGSESVLSVDTTSLKSLKHLDTPSHFH